MAAILVRVRHGEKPVLGDCWYRVATSQRRGVGRRHSLNRPSSRHRATGLASSYQRCLREWTRLKARIDLEAEGSREAEVEKAWSPILAAVREAQQHVIDTFGDTEETHGLPSQFATAVNGNKTNTHSSYSSENPRFPDSSETAKSYPQFVSGEEYRNSVKKSEKLKPGAFTEDAYPDKAAGP